MKESVKIEETGYSSSASDVSSRKIIVKKLVKEIKKNPPDFLVLLTLQVTWIILLLMTLLKAEIQ